MPVTEEGNSMKNKGYYNSPSLPLEEDTVTKHGHIWSGIGFGIGSIATVSFFGICFALASGAVLGPAGLAALILLMAIAVITFVSAAIIRHHYDTNKRNAKHQMMFQKGTEYAKLKNVDEYVQVLTELQKDNLSQNASDIKALHMKLKHDRYQITADDLHKYNSIMGLLTVSDIRKYDLQDVGNEKNTSVKHNIAKLHDEVHKIEDGKKYKVNFEKYAREYGKKALNMQP